MKNKYKLTDTYITLEDGRKLYQIQALRKFNDVNEGDLGGYVENEDNLSQRGNCWVYDSACAYDDCLVCGNAIVRDKATVCGKALVYGNCIITDNALVSDNANVYGKSVVCGNVTVNNKSKVYDNAYVSDNATIGRCSKVYENAIVSGDTLINDNAEVYGNANISGIAWVYDDAKVSGDALVCDAVRVYSNAMIEGDALLHGSTRIGDEGDICEDIDYITIQLFGSSTTFYIGHDNKTVYVEYGEGVETIKEFCKRVRKNEDRIVKKEFLSIIKMVKKHFKNN